MRDILLSGYGGGALPVVASSSMCMTIPERRLLAIVNESGNYDLAAVYMSSSTSKRTNSGLIDDSGWIF